MDKIMKTLIFLLILFAASTSYAVDAKLHADWAWNGTDTTIQGFKFYLNNEVVATIDDKDSRSADMVVNIDNGANQFSMTAYGPDWESNHSPEYKFEYIYIPDNSRPAPTVYIRIN